MRSASAAAETPQSALAAGSSPKLFAGRGCFVHQLHIGALYLALIAQGPFAHSAERNSRISAGHSPPTQSLHSRCRSRCAGAETPRAGQEHVASPVLVASQTIEDAAACAAAWAVVQPLLADRVPERCAPALSDAYRADLACCSLSACPAGETWVQCAAPVQATCSSRLARA